MREKCEECGEYKMCTDDSVCFDCVQDRRDLEDWVPEDGFDEDDSDEDEVEQLNLIAEE